MNADGTNRKRVTATSINEYDPTWSPDGRRLAFASDARGGGLFTIRSTAPYGRQTQILANPHDEFLLFASTWGPAWSTSGWIYYSRWEDWEGTLCDDGRGGKMFNPATRVDRWFGAALDLDPAPLGRAVVFTDTHNTGFCDEEFGISIANADGSNVREVTPPKETFTTPLDTEPVFSPDAKKVAFQRGRYVMTVNADGAGLKRLLIGSAPSWQPLR
jgi:Tol biopolymer transport system component